MRATLTFRNHQDFRARYSGTYGWYIKDNTRKLVQITNSDRNFVFFSDDSDFEFNAKVDSGINFEFIPVDKGWFNGVSGQVYFLCRHPARQWKRGIHVDNTLVYQINQMNFNIGVSYSVLSDIFIDNFDNWGKKEVPPYAISKQFAIDANRNVWFYNVIVGKVKDDVITLETPLVLQELTDVLKRKNFNYKVVALNG